MKTLSALTVSLAVFAAVLSCTATPSPSCRQSQLPYKLGIAGYTYYHVKDVDKICAAMQSYDCHYLCHKDFMLPYSADDAAIAAYKAKLAKYGIETLATGPVYMQDEATVANTFAFAKRFGLKVVVGVPNEKAADGQGNVESDKMLDIIEKYVKQYDICFAIHNHGPDMPRIYPTAEAALKRIGQRDRRIGVCLDVGHERRAGLDPVKFIYAHGDRIYDVHLKNIKVNAKQNIAKEGPRGELDINGILQALASVGYTGVAHIEYEKDFDDNLVPLAESVGYYRGCMDAVETAVDPDTVVDSGIDVIPLPTKFTLQRGRIAADKFQPVCKRDAAIPAEGYRLSVTASGITIVSADEDGEFYAKMTLRQLAKRTGDLPCCEIEDAPKYRYRGLMIDEGRHFFGKESIKRQLDLMAEHKLNFFHWHLTEDQGWRIEIKSHPELIQWGAKRPASPVRRTWDVEDGVPYGPFCYTQDEIREVLAYAKARHITVYPEIEMPGHSRALLAAHPELMCDGQTMDKRTPWTQWGVCDDVICVSNPETLKLYTDILNEVCDLFQDAPYIHIGGEECTRKHWAKCAKCQALKKREQMKSDDELQGWFTMKIYEIVHKKGKRLAGWSELSWGGIAAPKDTMLASGCGGTGAFTAAAGYDTVMAPTEYCYFYFNQGLKNDPYDYGWFWTGAVTLGQVYSFFPGYGIPPEYHNKIIGGEAHIWSEYTLDPQDLEWKLWPRGLALAEALWTGPELIFGINDFVRRAKLRRAELVKRGYNPARIEIEGLPRMKLRK